MQPININTLATSIRKHRPIKENKYVFSPTGRIGIPPKDKQRTSEEKGRIIFDYLEGKCVHDIARDHKIATGTVQSLANRTLNRLSKKAYTATRSKLMEGFMSQYIERLQRRVDERIQIVRLHDGMNNGNKGFPRWEVKFNDRVVYDRDLLKALWQMDKLTKHLDDLDDNSQEDDTQ